MTGGGMRQVGFLAAAATHALAGNGGSADITAKKHKAVRLPITQPTPGKCAALARNMAGEKPTHAASRPVTGMRVKNCSASR